MRARPLPAPGRAGRPPRRPRRAFTRAALPPRKYALSPPTPCPGIGGRIRDGDLKTLQLWSRRLNARTGRFWGPLKPYTFGSASGSLQAEWCSADGTPLTETQLVVGVGMRAHDDKLTTLWIDTGNLAPASAVVDTTGLKQVEETSPAAE